MVTKDLIKKRVLIGIGFSLVAFLVARVLITNYYKKKGVSKQSNFIGADGGDETFVAKRFDPSHVNKDGTKGATWISYNDSDIVGYWEKGKIEIGTKISGLI
jgi:hypothetical protein